MLTWGTMGENKEKDMRITEGLSLADLGNVTTNGQQRQETIIKSRIME